MLLLFQVFSNSPAEGELQRGDIILSINGRDAGSLTHKQAQDQIKFGGGQIELVVNRYIDKIDIILLMTDFKTLDNHQKKENCKQIKDMYSMKVALFYRNI